MVNTQIQYKLRLIYRNDFFFGKCPKFTIIIDLIFIIKANEYVVAIEEKSIPLTHTYVAPQMSDLVHVLQ